MNLTHLVTTYGYSAVFVIVAAESLGIPLPGETALIVAGAYAGHAHRLSPWVIFAILAIGVVLLLLRRQTKRIGPLAEAAYPGPL